MQGTAGTTEEQIRYTWNYAMLIARGPSHEALIKSPIFRAMESGTLARFEEITRCAAEVQDALISLLSEKRISVPELATEVPADKGFSVIATANTRDRGVNDMSAALKRRFNMVVLPTPPTLETEIDIVRKRVRELAVNLELQAERAGRRRDRAGRHHLPRAAHRARRSTARTSSKSPPACSRRPRRSRCWPTAWPWPATSAAGEVTAHDLAAGLQGAVVKDEEKDKIVWQEYLTNVAEEARRRVAAAVHGLLGA